MRDDRVDSPMDDRVAETSINREAEEKQERVPRYKQKSLTYIKKDPNYMYRVVNDFPGRIESFKAAGWEIVKGAVNDTYSGKGRKEVDPGGSALRLRVNPNNAYQDGVLMRIKKEWYDEDQRAKHQVQFDKEKDLDKKGQLTKARRLGPMSNIK